MKKLPKTEHLVMKYIWEQDLKLTAAKDVAAYMASEFGWLKPTTGKVLSRLVEKGFLKVEKIGRNLMYTILIQHQDYLKSETEEFFSFVHNKSLSSLVSTLGESGSLTNQDLDELEEWIKNRGGN